MITNYRPMRTSRVLLPAIVFAILLGCSTTLFADRPESDFLRSSPPEAGYIQQLMGDDQNRTSAPNARLRQRDIVNEMRSPIHEVPRQRDVSGEETQSIRQAVFDEAIFDQQYGRDSTTQPIAAQRFAEEPLGVQLAKYENESSFIDREKQSKSQDAESAHDLITRLGVNLAFVLAFAVGCILLVRHWQKSKGSLTGLGRNDAMRVRHVLRLTNTASLHIVNVSGSDFMIAIDTGGIKSVKPLLGEFEETFDRTQKRELSRSQRRELEPIVHDESTAEIDERLIKLLLDKSQQQAA